MVRIRLTSEQYTEMSKAAEARIDTTRCCGFDLRKGWDYFKLMPDDPDDRCPNPARFLYRTEFELIPLCAEHFDAWASDSDRDGDPEWGASGSRSGRARTRWASRERGNDRNGRFASDRERLPY